MRIAVFYISLLVICSTVSALSQEIQDSLSAAVPKRNLDTTMVWKARTSAGLSLKTNRMTLDGGSKLEYQDITLEAHTIAIQLDSNELEATPTLDSSGHLLGVPRFSDGKEQFFGEKIGYNIRTKRGVIDVMETTVDGNYYGGDRIKKDGDNVFYIRDGYFTTCDHPNPHFYFKASRMKVVDGKRIYAEPLVMYVEDVPIAAIPFGVYVENEKGRRSGILLPEFYFAGAAGSNSRGIVFEDFGYYWAVSDYFDTQLTANIATKGGYKLTSNNRYALRDVLNGNLELSYGYSRFLSTDPYSEDWSVTSYHTQSFDPNTKLTASLRFLTSSFYTNTSSDLLERQDKNIFSDASLYRNLGDGATLSLNYRRTQNRETGRIVESRSPNIVVSLPRIQPFENIAPSSSWLSDVSLRYSATAARTYNKQRLEEEVLIQDSIEIVSRDSSWYTIGVQHRPSISISPKLGYFTVSPSIQYSEDWFFRKTEKLVADEELQTTVSNGFFRMPTWSAGLSIGTRLFGITQFGEGGIEAFRHTLAPTVSLSYRPDFSEADVGYYKEYVDPTSGDTVEYSVFEADNGFAPRGESQTLSLRLSNQFDIRVRDTDTADARTVRLFSLDLNTSYNVASDSLKLGNITASLRSNIAGILSVNASGTFSYYGQTFNSDRGSWNIVRTAASDLNQGILRPVRANLSLSGSFSDAGFTSTPEVEDVPSGDSAEFGSADARYNIRTEEQHTVDWYGERSPGYRPWNVPWDLSVTLSGTYAQPNPELSETSVSMFVRGGFDLTDTWAIDGSVTWNVSEAELVNPRIELNKKLHEWNLNLVWQPTGPAAGFRLSFRAASSLLQDLKIERRTGRVY